MIKFVGDYRIRRTNCEELQIDLSGIYTHTTQSKSQYSEWKPWSPHSLIKVRNHSLTDGKAQCPLGEQRERWE